MRKRFKDRHMQAIYEACRRMGADNFSEFYYSAKAMGPRWPRRGAGHRNAYWNGRQGKPTSWARNSLAHAAWAAGQDDMKAASDRRLLDEFRHQLETHQ